MRDTALNESSIVPPMTDEGIKGVKRAVKKAIGTGGVYFVALIDGEDLEILTNVHRDDVGKFLTGLSGQAEDSAKLLKMEVNGRA